MQVIGKSAGEVHRPVPRVVKTAVSSEPDHDLLLFMFGLSQRMRPQS